MTNPFSRPLRIFLCHSSGDKSAVRELYQRLSAEGWIDVWLDEVKLLPGQDWDYEIGKALDNSDAVIVTLSTGSVSKEGYVQKELRFVLDIALEKPEGTIFVLPVRLDDCERPRRLRSIQGIDYFPPERRDWAYQRMLESLKVRATHLNLLVETSKEPLPPKSQQQNFSNPSLSNPTTTDPPANSLPVSAISPTGLASNAKPIWMYGRLLTLLLMIFSFLGPWTKYHPAARRFGEYDWYETFLIFERNFNSAVLIYPAAFLLFLLTVVRLIPSRHSDRNYVLVLEKFSAVNALIVIFTMLFGVDDRWNFVYLLWGIWILVASVYLASVNLLFEMRFTLHKGQKWSWWSRLLWWAWLLVILFTLTLLLYLYPVDFSFWS